VDTHGEFCRLLLPFRTHSGNQREFLPYSFGYLSSWPIHYGNEAKLFRMRGVVLERGTLQQLGFSVSGGIVAQNQLSRPGYGYSVNPATGNCFRAPQRYGRCSSWLSARKTFRQQATVVPPKKEGELTGDYVSRLAAW